MSKLKLPKLTKSAKDTGDSAESKAPKFLSDLYRDLADRRLLLPLAALLVGIVAVPMLLSSSPEPTVPPAASPLETAAAESLSPAVIVSDPGIRDYRERLAALKARNPFESQSSPPSGGGGGAAGGGGGGGSQASGSAAAPSTDSSTSSSSSSSSTTSTSTGSSASGSSSSSTTVDSSVETTTDTSTGGTTDTTTDTTVDESVETNETRFYTSRVDVKVGTIGDMKTIDGVRQLQFLPNEKAPVVAFLGLVGGTDRALFSVNPLVAETQGEGACAPRRANTCQYVELKVGEEQQFVYGDEEDARVYRLKLLETHVVRIPDPREERGGDGDGASNGSE